MLILVTRQIWFTALVENFKSTKDGCLKGTPSSAGQVVRKSMKLIARISLWRHHDVYAFRNRLVRISLNCDLERTIGCQFVFVFQECCQQFTLLFFLFGFMNILWSSDLRFTKEIFFYFFSVSSALLTIFLWQVS